MGYDCINQGANGKNIITVGAVHKIAGGYQSPSDVKAASFSAFGPTDDGRIKPDLVGIGVNVFSANSDRDSSYEEMSGTSMASPNVTGSLALVQEYYNKNYSTTAQPFMRANTLKALTIHTANEAGEHAGPDYKFGWGLLNVLKAVEVLSVKDNFSFINENTLQNRSKYEIKVKAHSSTEPLKVTIVWDDPAPATENMPAYTLNNRQSVLVNDLDLRITDGVETFYPWVLNPDKPTEPATREDNARDNVEQIIIDHPVEGKEYTIMVSSKRDLRKNLKQGERISLVDAQSQNFSMVVTGINNAVTKDLALKSINLPKPIEFSAATPVTVEVENIAEEPIAGTKLKYQLINSDEKDDTQKIVASGEISLETINKGETLSKSFNLDLSKSFIHYEIVAEVVAEGDRVKNNNKKQVSAYGVIADLTQKESAYQYGFESEFEKNGWSTADNAPDGTTWQIFNGSAEAAHSGLGFALNFTASQSDDWLFSNPLKLSKGKPYKIEFYARTMDDGKNEPLEIFIGKNPVIASMAQKVGSLVVNKEAHQKFSFEFIAQDNGIAYIGIQNKVSLNNVWVGIDDFSVKYAEGKPAVNFSTTKQNINSFETIAFTNETTTASTQPAAYEWSFSPATVEYKDGTTKISAHPKLRFLAEGKYSVSLKATNTEGESILQKEDFITVKNTPAKADFRASTTEISEGQTVAFTNTSTGNPSPQQYEWSIHPSEGVSFVGSSSPNSINLMAKFNTYGDYSVSLKASSPLNTHTEEKKFLIRVNGSYEGIKNLKGNYDENTHTVHLRWDRPNLKPQYNEDFPALIMPAGMTSINANSDGNNWEVRKVDDFMATEDNFTAYSYSYRKGKAYTMDNWLITPKLRGGAETLKYSVRMQYKERYDVYIIPAPADGSVPNLNQLRAGAKVYTYDGGKSAHNFFTESFNIKNEAKNDFFIAFHHRTKDTDNSQDLVIDNIAVGYDNSIKAESKQIPERLAYQEIDYRERIGLRIPRIESPVLAPQGEIFNKEFGMTNLPFVTGYEIHKNGSKIGETSSVEALSFSDVGITSTGTYTYDVYALYSDGVKSNKKSLTIEVPRLATTDVEHSTAISISPNPSSGKFSLSLPTSVSRFTAEVYDLTANLLLRKEFRTNTAEINLTGYPKGAYLVRIIQNDGSRHSAKLIIQ